MIIHFYVDVLHAENGLTRMMHHIYGMIQWNTWIGGSVRTPFFGMMLNDHQMVDNWIVLWLRFFST